MVAVGGAVLDRHLWLVAAAVPGTSNPARAGSSSGGVARNVAETLALLGVPVRLVSRVGDDEAGRELLARLRERGVDVAAVAVASGEATALYVAVIDPGGDLVLGVAAMEVLDGIRCAAVEAAWPRPGDWLFLDCNVPADVLARALARAGRDGTPVAVDAVSTPKVRRLAHGPHGLAGVDVLFCNRDEAQALVDALGTTTPDSASALATALVAAGARRVVLTLGARGAVIADAAGPRAVAARPADVVDVTGAGDALVAATLSRLVVGESLDDAVATGVRAAALTVAHPASVRPDLAARLAARPGPANRSRGESVR